MNSYRHAENRQRVDQHRLPARHRSASFEHDPAERAQECYQVPLLVIGQIQAADVGVEVGVGLAAIGVERDDVFKGSGSYARAE